MRASNSQPNPAAIAADTLIQKNEYCNVESMKMQLLLDAASAFFQKNMNPYYPTSTVWREGAIALLLSKPIPAIGEMKIKTNKYGKLTLNEYIVRASIDGLILVHRGTIVFESYKQMHPFDKREWGSVSKTVIATCVGLLEAEGKIELSKPIATYLPELVECDWQGTPVVDILNMTAELHYTKHCLDSNKRPQQLLQAIKYVQPSGSICDCNSINTFVLQRLVERVTNQPINEFISDRIWRQIGAQANAFLFPDGDSLGCLRMSSTLRDIACYGMLFTPSWSKVSQQCVVPQSVVNKIQDSRRKSAIEGIDYLEALGERPFACAYQWDWVMTDGDFFKSGGGGQGLYISPIRDLVIAYFHGDRHAGDEAIARILARSILF